MVSQRDWVGNNPIDLYISPDKIKKIMRKNVGKIILALGLDKSNTELHFYLN